MGAQGAEDAGGPGRDAGAGAFPGRRIPRLGHLALLQLVHASGPVSGGHHLETAPGAGGLWPGRVDSGVSRTLSASPFRKGDSQLENSNEVVTSNSGGQSNGTA